MNRTALTFLAFAMAASQASAQTSTPAAQSIITERPDPNALKLDEKALLIDPKLLLSLLAPPDPDPAMNNPDKVAWELFIEANKPSSQSGKVIFETWPSDPDTFSPSACLWK